MNGSFVDLETGLVQGVPPHSDTEDEENWEMQELSSPADEEIEERSGSLSPSTEGSSAGLDSIWTMQDDDATSATTARPEGEDDDSVTIKPSTSRR